jgi:hypothetical protein
MRFYSYALTLLTSVTACLAAQTTATECRCVGPNDGEDYRLRKAAFAKQRPVVQFLQKHYSYRCKSSKAVLVVHPTDKQVATKPPPEETCDNPVSDHCKMM